MQDTATNTAQDATQDAAKDARVALLKQPDYGPGLADALRRLLAPLGGLESIVRPGQSVLIKPNLLTDRPPDQAVTTHPEWVRVVIRELRRIGARISVADSPATAVKLERVWQTTGFAALCAEENVPLINLEKAGSRPFERAGISFSIARPVLEADLIINMPKVKTHVLTILTAAVKNFYGVVPGFQKSALHARYPTPAEFGHVIAELYRQMPPALNLADGIMGLEGDGPSAGTPVHLGFVAASTDAVALDLVLCRILGIRPATVPYLKPFLAGRIAGDIETVGEAPDAILQRPFKAPSTLRGRMIPGPLVKLLGPLCWIRPFIDDTCIQCGRCVQACPVQALAMAPGSRPVLNPRLCIGCCCCHEICPQKAISMRQSPLLNFVRRGNMP